MYDSSAILERIDFVRSVKNKLNKRYDLKGVL